MTGTIFSTFQLLNSSDETLQQEQHDVFSPQPIPETYVDDFGAWLIMRRASARENMRQLSNLNAELKALIPKYGEIQVPVEILHGDADKIVNYQDNAPPLKKAIEGANLITLESMGHAPNYVVPETVEKALLRLSARAPKLIFD